MSQVSRETVRLSAATQGQIVELPEGLAAARAEVVTFGQDLTPALLRVPLEGRVRVAGWPVAAAERADVLLTRFEVYAPDARIWKVEGERHTELPRSRLAFFRGEAENDPAIRVFVAVDPDAAEGLSGLIASPKGMQEIHPLKEVEPRAAAGEYLVAPAETFFEASATGGDSSRAWSCDQDGAPPEFLRNQAEASTTLPIFAEAITSLHSATVAVDTDNEFVNVKFAGNATAATNYIANLFAAMTVIYERDLLVRLLQGQTFLRTGSGDPYTSTGSTSEKLEEFRTYWNANQTAVPRAVAAMLSARGGSGASGVAWIDVLCSKTYGYSYTQLFTSGTSVSSGEVMVVAHEIGHNFGSPHTHCYNPPLDNCYNTASGCYTGTKTCPAATTINGVPNVRGTLMSYCHLGGIGCTTSNVFHPGSVALLAPKIQAKVNACIFPMGTPPPPPAPTISTLSPPSGTTAGGTSVVITGANFQSGATVTFGGTPATSVTFNSSTRLTVRTPARAAGKVAVVVTNPGGQTGTKSPGYFYAAPAVAGDFYTVAPCRVLDTRNATGPLGGPALAANGERTFKLTGACGIPAAAKSVVANVTVFAPPASGSLGIFPGNAFDLGTIINSFAAGGVRASSALLTLATDGTGTILVRNSSAGTANVIIDVSGYF